MTEKEAIGKIKEILEEATKTEDAVCYVTSVDAGSLNLAIEALEKQIPRKAIGEHYAHMRCPSCNHRIPSGLGSSSRRRDNWCNYCGQKILWSEEE